VLILATEFMKTFGRRCSTREARLPADASGSGKVWMPSTHRSEGLRKRWVTMARTIGPTTLIWMPVETSGAWMNLSGSCVRGSSAPDRA